LIIGQAADSDKHRRFYDIRRTHMQTACFDDALDFDSVDVAACSLGTLAFVAAVTIFKC